MSQPAQPLRQPVVVVLGHTDAGKCVSEDTLIQLAGGRILEARQVFETYKTGAASHRPDGEVYEARDLRVISVDKEGNVAPRKVSHVWKLKTDRLVNVSTKAGYSVKCTPEHKFLSMSKEGELRYVEAENLALGDRLVLPSKTCTAEGDLLNLKSEILLRLSDDFLVRVSSSLNKRIADFSRGGRERVGAEIGDKELMFHVRQGYYRAGAFRKLAASLGIPLALAYDSVEGIRFSSPKRRASQGSPWIRLPRDGRGFESLSYVVGLLYGDGVAGSGDLANSSDSIMDAFLDSLMSAFGVGASRAWRRSFCIVSHRGGKTLARFLTEAFEYPESDKTRNLRIPELVSIMPDLQVAAFLRGFFDAEGFVQEGKYVGAGCESRMLMKQLPMLLQRFGCLSYSGKKTRSREIFISGKDNISAFLKHVGFKDKEKMLCARRTLSSSETNRVFDTTPIPGDFLRSVMDSNRAIWDDQFQLTSSEAHQKLSRYVLRRLPSVVPTYENQSAQRLIEDFATVQVTSVEEIQGGCFVYDFTVDDCHNFLANGLIIHNTSFLDKLRGTSVQGREAGGITQEIGASFFPMETLTSISGQIMNKTGAQLKIPGLLIIDTPGHEVFSNLRMRGGSAADIAIVLVDVLKGLENQTLESIEILKQRKVPFLVALNKVDMIKGWRKESKGYLASVIKEQPPQWSDELEERLYNVVGGLSRLGFDSDAFYRVKDFRKQVSIVPISARYGVGMPELLAVLIGLAQQFLSEKLVAVDEKGRARGIILELQEETGIGQTANIILTEGRLAVGDKIVLVRRDGAIASKVKALFMPKPLDEMRDPRDKFTPVQEVYSAAGVKLVSTELDGVIPGTSVIAFHDEKEFQTIKSEAEKDLGTLVSKVDIDGVIVKAGNIGGLEALIRMLDQREIPVRMADIGDITKRDMIEAEAVAEHDPYLGAIIGFDVKVVPEAKEAAAKAQIITSDVIYDAIEGYVQWAATKREHDERSVLSTIVPPAKLKALPGMFFRRNDPAVFGVEVVAGRLKPKVRLMDSSGVELGTVEQIQENAKPVQEATKGMQVAISVRGPTLGRQIRENDSLYSFPTSHDVKLLKGELAGTLKEDDQEALNEIISIRSVKDMMYGF
ncbi:MAG: translation initiation factor IF-2 [Nitrososphaerota archaeon]|nr:translation initiation factor IF-2 [Nitrososphaerota archaeon]